MKREVVFAEEIEANGFWNHFTGKKKWTITCGKCSYSWQEKVPIKENCTAICSCCGALNQWSASRFEAVYKKNINIE